MIAAAFLWMRKIKKRNTLWMGKEIMADVVEIKEKKF